VVGSVVTNTLNLLGDVNVLGTLAVNGNSVLTNAWQNPASASYWTWTSDGNEITLTGYTGPNAVVIPDMLDGLPVTGFGTIFSPELAGSAITSISDGANVTTIGNSAFFNCTNLTSISLPNATTIGGYAFFQCSALTSVTLPNATTIEDFAFFSCIALTSVYFDQNAPAESVDVYFDAPNVTNYVTNPQATGWTNSWSGRPVVRLPVYADSFVGGGLALTQAATTTRDSGFAGNELVTADFVRGLFAAGAEMYPTTNRVTTTITPTGTVYYASDSPLATATAFTITVTGVNHYVMSILDTNVVLAGETFSGPANVEIWIQSAAGAQTALSVKPELYLVPTQDLASITVPTVGDWDAAPQVVTLGTTTNRYMWTIAWPDHVIASNSYRLARLKVTTKGANTTAMKIAAGGIYTSHLSMKTPSDTGLGARGATNATLDGVAQTYDATTRTFILTNTAAGIAAAGGALTSDVSFAAAPACYQLTLTNTSALSWTNTWLPTSKVSRVTLTSTGTTTFVWNWPTQQDAGMRFALDMTGMPSVVFPAGAIYLVNGVFTNTAPSLFKSNYVSVIHDCNTYQIMAITNTIGTWGTP
jgi:hypothetical protein